MACQVITVQGKQVHCPDWLPSKGWSIHSKGYVIYTSRKKQELLKRGEYMHRVVLRVLGGGRLGDDCVHHQNHVKTFNCPGNLIAMPSVMNPAPSLRCPITGQFLKLEEYKRRYA